MKQNIFERNVYEEVVARINKLTTESKGKWGRLSAPQMIRHLNEACKMAFDEVKVPDQSNLFTRTLGKWLFLRNVKPPGRQNGTVKTFPQIDIVETGFPVMGIEDEKKSYVATLDRLNKSKDLSKQHPLFGKMSRDDWGLLAYAHADYHLTQFNL